MSDIANPQTTEAESMSSAVASDALFSEEHWKDIDFAECGECGSDDVECLTEEERDGWVTDGDIIRCKECGELGQIMCDSEMPATDFWNRRDGFDIKLLNTEASERPE